MFKKGDIVTWSSQSQGRTRTKTGEIIFVVGAGMSTSRAASVFSNHHITFYGGLPRNHESYLVSVKTGKTDKAQRSLYWPRVPNLKKV